MGERDWEFDPDEDVIPPEDDEPAAVDEHMERRFVDPGVEDEDYEEELEELLERAEENLDDLLP